MTKIIRSVINFFLGLFDRGVGEATYKPRSRVKPFKFPKGYFHRLEVSERRKARDELRKRIGKEEGVNWGRVVLLHAMNDPIVRTHYVIKPHAARR